MNKWARPVDWNSAAAQSAGRGSASPATQYFAFLSYSHQDSADADWLHKELERFRVPSSLAGRLTENGVIPKRLTPVFRDRHELAAAADLGAEIRTALASSRFLIVLCSPAAAASEWTNAEIELFKRLHPDGCVIAAIVAGEPFASEIRGREAEECLPPALRQKYDRRGRPIGKRAEPLAADLRETGDGRRLGFLKVVAGMLGVGLDDLVQRDQLRRQRRLATISGASFLGMIAALVLAVTAIEARDAARDQRREAEGLVEFMLGDLKDKLEPIGKLDVLDGVGSRVLAYYGKQDMAELSDSALLQRSRALSLTAQVAYLRGDLAEATRLYREAMAGTAEAVRRNPDDPQRLFDHAQNVFWIGDIAGRRGQPREAENAFREYKRLADRMLAIDLDNLKWRMEAAYADHNIAIMYRNQRRFAEAARDFRSAVGLFESVAAIEPGNAEYQSALANGMGWLADSESDQGNLQAAIRIRERQIAFLRKLIANGSTNVDLRLWLVPAHTGLGILLSSTGEPARSIEQLRLAVAEGDRLIAIEPDNSYSKGFTAQAQIQLARTLLAIDRQAEAGAEIGRGCAVAAQILARDPGPNWRRLQTSCLSVRSLLALETGTTAEALSFAERGLASARSERSADPITDRYAIAAAFRLLGDVRQRMGNVEPAKEAWNAGLAQLPSGANERPREMYERALLLERLDRNAEARPLAEKLRSMGFSSVR